MQKLNDININDNDNIDNNIDSKFYAILFSQSFFILYISIVSRNFSFSFSSSSSTSSFEMIEKQNDKNTLSSILHFVLKLWFEKFENFRLNYVRLRKILQLTKSMTNDQNNANNVNVKFSKNANYENVIKMLSFKFDSFKRQNRRHLFLLQFMWRIVSIIIEKMFSLTKRKKERRQRQKIIRIVWQYWFNSIKLIKIIFAITKLRNEMHFDMIEYVDENTKLWHFRTWKFFIRAIFDDVFFIKRNELIISNDIIRIKKKHIINEYIINCDRMIFIEKNKRNDSSMLNAMKIIIQAIVNNFHLFIERYVLKFFAIHSLKLFLFENINHEYNLKNIDRLFSIHLNREYDENEKNQQNFENEYFIRKFLIDENIKFVRFVNQIKIKLKMKYFDKNYVIEIFDKSHIFLSYFFLLMISIYIKICINHWRFSISFLLVCHTKKTKNRQQFYINIEISWRQHERRRRNYSQTHSTIRCMYKNEYQRCSWTNVRI